MTKPLGYCLISPHALAAALPLPVDTEIIGADWDADSKSIVLLVRHADVPQGADLPQVVCSIATESRAATAYDTIKQRVARWLPM
jgi:hypothetical protein